MARKKKDGEKISLYLDRETMERMREHASARGQTLTVAMERALKMYLDQQSNIMIDEVRKVNEI